MVDDAAIEAVPGARADAPAKRVRRCKCGHEKGHAMVSATGDYSFWGWVLIVIGISAKPVAIRYVCRRCEQTIDRTTDPAIIAETQLWG